MARQKQELQREIERHLKKNADQLQYFSNQIQNLKGVATKPFTRIQRPCCKSQNIVREEKVFQKSSIKQPKCVMRDQKVKMINVINITKYKCMNHLQICFNLLLSGRFQFG